MIPVPREMTGEGVLLDLMVVKSKGVMSKVSGSALGHSDHQKVEFKISGDRRKSGSNASTLAQGK